MSKITAIFIHRINRKMTIETRFERNVESEIDAEEAGKKDAKIQEAYMNGFGNANVRRY